jgi:predicted permease
MFERVYRRVRYWLRSGERARELREEMALHLEEKVQALVDEGMAEADARLAARRQFGNPTLHQETARATWVARWWTDLLQDLVFAIRTIRRQPGFTTAAVVSAALGIGAVSLIYGLVNSALFRPLPVQEPSRLVSITGVNLTKGKRGQSMSYPDIVDLREAQSFEGIATYSSFMPATIATNGEPQRYWGAQTSANYFDVVRPAFAAGRGFDAASPEANDAQVVVLSYQLWHSRFNGDPAIVGRPIALNGRQVTVVGVTGPGFRGTERMFFSDFWLPFSADSAQAGSRFQDRGGQWALAVGRLRQNANLRTAAAEVDVIGGRLRTQFATNRDRAFHVERAGQVNPGFRQIIVGLFLMLLLMSALVLFTACANIANLLLARASARRQEIATRLAIGAGRGRLVRQLLTESVLLGLLGGIGGFAIAQFGADSIGRSRIPLPLPIDVSVSLDYRVLLFCVALSIMTGVVFGLVPALRATRPDLISPIKEQPSRPGRSRRFGLRGLLVMSQMAMCMVLLICAGLFLRSLRAAAGIDIGFTQRNLLMMAFDPGLNGYTPAQTRRLLDAMRDAAGSMPGIESVSLTNSVPLSLEGTQNGFVPDDKIGQPNGSILADIYAVGPGFFETLGIRMLAGADFRRGDPAGGIAIVNQALADKAFPRQDVVGRRIQYFGRMIRITAVVATTKSRSIGEDPRPSLYFPLDDVLRGNDSQTGITLVVRTSGDPAGYVQDVRRRIHDLDPTLPLFDVRTMETHLSEAMYFPRVTALMFGLAGVMGLLIATIGIYGVVSFGVARQAKEIGIRIALGATRRQVLGQIVRQGLAPAIPGAVAGLAMALGLSRVAAGLLYGVSATDAVTFIGVPAFLLSIAALACFVPARRAASLDPMTALRTD